MTQRSPVVLVTGVSAGIGLAVARAAYRANIANVQQNMRLHGGFESLAGQEKDFTIRCNC